MNAATLPKTPQTVKLGPDRDRKGPCALVVRSTWRGEERLDSALKGRRVTLTVEVLEQLVLVDVGTELLADPLGHEVVMKLADRH